MSLDVWNEIKYILWDFDLTLGDTQRVFKKWHDEAKLHLSRALGVFEDEINEKFDVFWRQGHSLYNVDPDELIRHTVLGFRNDYPSVSDQTLDVFSDLLYRTYFERIDLFEDVIPVFDDLRARGIKMGVVSHASEEWSSRKREWTGIDKFLVKDGFFCVDVRYSKTPEAWINGAKSCDFDLKKTLVCGDNLRADANAAIEADFYGSCWLFRENELKTTVGVREGVKHEKVVTVKDLYQVRDLVISNNEKGV